MAYYFFTELDKLNNQNTSGNGEAYGPTSAASGKDRFRITSTHKVSMDAEVIAVCKGTILVQEQIGSSDLVNIILKPFQQPPFEFPKIKYFIYRGVKKSSLANGVDIAAKITNDLTNSLWTDYNKFYNNATDQAPPNELLGLGMNTANAPYRATDLMDGLFCLTGADHQLPTVQAGWRIATFDHTVDIGFEIMFESLCFEPTLELARKADNIIEVTTLTGSPTQAVFFEHWHDKEDILNYIDPCAFWGSFYTKNLTVKLSNNSIDKKKEEALYTDVLSLYKNKNKCYLDIRNEFNFSLNYFKNYGTSATNNTTNIKLGKGSNTITAIDYYTNGWPILIIDNTGFSSTSNHYQEISLHLPCGNGDNPAPLVYLSRAYKPGVKFPETFNLKQKFLPLTVNSDYTYVFKVAIPWVSGNLYSSFIKVKYCKRFARNESTTISSSGTVIRPKEDYNFLFEFKNLNSFIDETDLTTIQFNDEVYFGIVNLGFSKDIDNVVLFSTFINKYSNDKKISNSNFDLVYSKSQSKNILKLLSELNPNIKEKEYKIDLTEEPEGIIQNVTNFISNTFNEKFKYKDVNEFRFVSINLIDFADIESRINSSFIAKYPVYIGVNYLNDGIDLNGLPFNRYELVACGYENDSTNNSVKVKVIDLSSWQYISNPVQANQNAIDSLNPQIIQNTTSFSKTENTINNITTFTIKCKMYLVKGPGVTEDQINTLRDYVEAEIKQVWKSASSIDGNRGMPNIVTLFDNGNYVEKNVVINCNDLEVVTSNVIPTLHQDEVCMLVLQNFGKSRSFVRNARFGVYYIGDSGKISFLEPSHEFGHLLGLADRYLPIMWTEAKPINSSRLTQGKAADGSMRYCEHVAMYIPESYDIDYTSNFKWIHNLMGLRNMVPKDNIHNDPKYNIWENIFEMIEYQNSIHQFRPVLNKTSVITPTGYDILGIFISRKQLELILSGLIEDSPHVRKLALFISVNDVDNKNGYQGTFAGLDRNSGKMSKRDNNLETNKGINMEQRVIQKKFNDWFAPSDYNSPINIGANLIDIELGGHLDEYNVFMAKDISTISELFSKFSNDVDAYKAIETELNINGEVIWNKLEKIPYTTTGHVNNVNFPNESFDAPTQKRYIRYSKYFQRRIIIDSL